MRNKIDFSLPPEKLFLNPWQDPGFALLEKPEFAWQPRPGGNICGFAVSAHPQINQKIEHFLKVTERDKVFAEAIEYNSVPILLNDVDFRKSHVLSGGRVVLGGASGTRAINQFRWEAQQNGQDADAVLGAYFHSTGQGNEGRQIPVETALLDPDIPFAVECRNTFNYFHFITESLSQLTVLDGLDFQGDIFFHFPNQENKQRPFAEAFVNALFPEFKGRVTFERAPKRYDRVLTAYDLIGGHYQAPFVQSDPLLPLMPKAMQADIGAQSVVSRTVLAMNAVNTSLLSLRKRALRAVKGKRFDHLPRRFFVGRDTRQSRERHMEGEALLFEHLQMFGFEYVTFENLSPLEQIAIMSRAEMMVSYHGAGFTNMLFAAKETVVIELGTLQTAQFRWGDFWPLAHASECSYISFFGDFKTENPLVEPQFATDGIVPGSFSDAAIGHIMAFIVTLFGHCPTLSSAQALEPVAAQVLKAGAARKAVALLDAHPDLMDQNANLCLIKADCHKAMGEPKSELLALDMAFKADPARWQTLVRMIWCANGCDRPQVIRWAISRLKSDFPDRHDAFVKNHDWVRFVA